MMNHKYIFLFLIIQCFSLSSHEFPYDDIQNCTFKPDLEFNNHYQQSQNNAPISWDIKGGRTPESFGLCAANNSIVFKNASPALQNYFTKVISPIIYYATITNHHIAIPGYMFPDGLRYCINQLSQFAHSDKKIVKELTQRLEIYCSKIEAHLFTGKNYEFNDTVSRGHRVALARLYADFLKEFYTAKWARYFFANQAHNNPLMKQIMPSINWNFYDTRGVKGKYKNIEQKHAPSINNKLGAVYKALHNGDAEKAYNLGHEKVHVIMRKKQVTSTVFDRYPELYKKVKAAYFADKTKAEEIRLAKEAALQKEATMMKEYYEKRSADVIFEKHPDLFAHRYAALMMQCRDPQFFEKLHKILLESTPHFEPQHLTPDETGILLEGGQLQHSIVDESISVIDTALSRDLDDKIHDTVIELANEAITLTKDENVLMASQALDACWTLLDYGQAVAEGAAVGAYTAISDVLTNPVGTIISMVAGKQILIYQFCKVLCNVADIGITSLIDLEQARNKWESYTKPVNEIVDKINTGEITGRDIAKGGSAFIVGLLTQSKIQGELRNFGNNIKQATINFIRENSVIKPPAHLTTPEDLFLKSDIDPSKIKQAGKTVTATKVKNKVQSEVAKNKVPKSSKLQNNKPTSQATLTNIPIAADKGIIRNPESSLRSTIQRYEGHIFSKKHINDGIMNLGKDKETIMNSLYDIIVSLDKKGLLQEGSNKIKATINGFNNVEIKCFIQKGEALSVDAHFSDFNRIYGNFIDFTKI